MLDQTATIEKFLDAAAAKQPTPGGGSVAALSGALAAVMGEMVLNYSVGKKGLEEHEPTLKRALAEFHKARQIMMELMSEDQTAYEALTAARKLPADAPKREETIVAAAKNCARVPQTIAATAVAVLDLSDKFVEFVNRQLLSDLAVCCELAMAATRAALYNVRVNLPAIPDPKQREQIQAAGVQILSNGVTLVQRVMPRIWQRISHNT